MDVQELGVGPENPTTVHEIGVTSPDGGKPRKIRKRGSYKQVLTEAQKERKRAWTRAAYKKNPDRYIGIAKSFYARNRDKVLEQKSNRKKLDPSVGERQRAYASANKETYMRRSKEWISKNPERYKQNKIAYLPRRRELCKIRRAENPNRRLSENLRTRIYMLVKRNNPKIRHHTYEILGCTPDFFRNFLEAQFTPEMNWSNYGSFWNVDHVMPLASFNLSDENQVKLAFNYSNCRPLEKEKNSAKNDSCPGPHQPLLV